MTPFSDLLSAHVKAKNIKTFSLAQYCGMDRSNMYKILNGKRNPSSIHMVQSIADFLRLTPLERYDLLEAYQITITGYDTYYRRKHVQDFITYFSHRPDNFPEMLSYNMNLNLPVQSNGILISGKAKLKHVIYDIFATETVTENGFIRLFFQPDTEEFMDVLMYIGKAEKTLQIEHLFCMTNSDKILSDKYDYNLICLQKIIPMYYNCVCSYTPYCYYDNILSHNNIFNLFSSMIITSRHAFVFSPQLQYGFLFNHPDILLKLQDIFEELKSNASLVIRKQESFYTQFEFFNNIDIANQPGYSFQQEPCLIPLMPLSFPEKYLTGVTSGQEHFLAMVKQYISKHAAASHAKTTQYFFSESGIQYFLESGRISELPPSIYRPMEYDDRAFMMQNLIHACHTQGYRMLKPHVPIAASTLDIYVTSQKGYLMFIAADGKPVCLDLTEPGLLHAFYDYLGSLTDNMFYTEDETDQILKNLLD